MARELGDRKGLVIATGGRMILDPANHRELSRHGRIFCLVATPEDVLRRIAADDPARDRPLLQVEDPRRRILELMTERQPHYRRFPQIATSNRDPGVIADEIGQLWLGPSSHRVTDPGGGYEVTVGVGILPFVRQLASINGPLVVITDQDAADLYLGSLGDVEVEVVLSSGPHDQAESVELVHSHLRASGIDETATVVSLGRSSVGDIAGQASAGYMSGLALVLCPTDLAGMVEVGGGGPLGRGVSEGWDLVGGYRPPSAVVADVATLQTQSRRDLASELAEVIEHIEHMSASGSTLLDRIPDSSWADTESPRPGELVDLQSLVLEAVRVGIASLDDTSRLSEDRRTAVLDHGDDLPR